MSSGFVSEAEILEARNKRQAEWEKVRESDQPLEKPDEPYDGRSLFEQLKQQKDKRDCEYEEAHKLKNMIRGLDDDEIDFLDFVDRTKMTAEKTQLMEDHKELEEFREKVATLQEKSHDQKLQAQHITKPKAISSTIGTKRLSQKSILSSVIIKKRKASVEEIQNDKHNQNIDQNGDSNQDEVQSQKNCQVMNKSSSIILKTPSALNVIGILPGLGHYKSCSSSESEDDGVNFDLVGKKIQRKENEC